MVILTDFGIKMNLYASFGNLRSGNQLRSCRAGQLTYSHCSWPVFERLCGYPVVSAHTIASYLLLSFFIISFHKSLAAIR